MSAADDPLDPEVDDVTAPWWDATRSQRLLVQTCSACGAAQHYPRPLCLRCSGTQLAFVEASGRAVLHAFTEVQRAPSAAFDAPYVVGLVDLEEGPRLLAPIVDAAADDLRCDGPLDLTWRPLPDGRHLPAFRPAGR